MRLSKTSTENLRVADRVGFDEADSGVLIYVEKHGNRGYLYDNKGDIICCRSVAECITIIRRVRPELIDVRQTERRKLSLDIG